MIEKKENENAKKKTPKDKVMAVEREKGYLYETSSIVELR